MIYPDGVYDIQVMYEIPRWCVYDIQVMYDIPRWCI